MSKLEKVKNYLKLSKSKKIIENKSKNFVNLTIVYTIKYLTAETRIVFIYL